MPTAYSVRHEFGGRDDFEVAAFRTRREAAEYVRRHPTVTVHSAGGRIDQIPNVIARREIPAIVPCAACGTGLATSKDPKAFPYCRNCFYTGQAYAHKMARTLAEFDEGLAGSGLKASVEHTGGGCFMLVLQSEIGGEGEYYALTDGDAAVDTGYPARWGYIGRISPVDDEQVALIYDVYESLPPPMIGSVGPGEPIPDEWYERDVAADAAKIGTAEAIALIAEDIANPKPTEASA